MRLGAAVLSLALGASFGGGRPPAAWTQDRRSDPTFPTTAHLLLLRSC